VTNHYVKWDENILIATELIVQDVYSQKWFLQKLMQIYYIQIKLKTLIALFEKKNAGTKTHDQTAGTQCYKRNSIMQCWANNKTMIQSINEKNDYEGN
jgi:hypothetical protein